MKFTRTAQNRLLQIVAFIIGAALLAWFAVTNPQMLSTQWVAVIIVLMGGAAGVGLSSKPKGGSNDRTDVSDAARAAVTEMLARLRDVSDEEERPDGHLRVDHHRHRWRGVGAVRWAG